MYIETDIKIDWGDARSKMTGQPITAVCTNSRTVGIVGEVHSEEENLLAIVIQGPRCYKQPGSVELPVLFDTLCINTSSSKVYRIPDGRLYITLPHAEHAIIG